MVRPLLDSKVFHKYWMLWRGYGSALPLKALKMFYMLETALRALLGSRLLN